MPEVGRNLIAAGVTLEQATAALSKVRNLQGHAYAVTIDLLYAIGLSPARFKFEAGKIVSDAKDAAFAPSSSRKSAVAWDGVIAEINRENGFRGP